MTKHVRSTRKNRIRAAKRPFKPLALPDRCGLPRRFGFFRALFDERRTLIRHAKFKMVNALDAEPGLFLSGFGNKTTTVWII
jgi:hypothetical protein